MELDGCVRDDDLLRLFSDRAPSTLKRHLSGCRAWVSFCACLGWRTGPPKVSQLLDFPRGLAEGAALDRGKGRVASARSVLSAVTFYKLRLTALAALFGISWKTADKWGAPPLTRGCTAAVGGGACVRACHRFRLQRRFLALGMHPSDGRG